MKTLTISLTKEEFQYLEAFAETKTGQAQVADRARILLLKSEGMTFQDIAEIMDLSTRTVQARVSRYRKNGLNSALFDNLRPGRPPEISAEAKGWLLSAAQQKPSALGCHQEKWTLKGFYDYIQTHADKAGFPRLSVATKVYVRKILKDAGIIWT